MPGNWSSTTGAVKYLSVSRLQDLKQSARQEGRREAVHTSLLRRETEAQGGKAPTAASFRSKWPVPMSSVSRDRHSFRLKTRAGAGRGGKVLGLSLPPRIKSPAGCHRLGPPSRVRPELGKSGLICRVEQAGRKDQKFLSHLLAQAKCGRVLLSGRLWRWCLSPTQPRGVRTPIHHWVTAAQKGEQLAQGPN